MPLQPWKVPEYTALITQSSEENPVLTVLYNTLADLEWERTSTGSYICTNVGLFIPSNTIITTENNLPLGNGIIRCWVQNIDEINIRTYNAAGTLTDGILYNTPIKIQIYRL